MAPQRGRKATRRLLLLAACLYGVSLTSSATDQTFGDWVAVSLDNGTGDAVAATFSDGTKTMLAVRCLAKSQGCFHLVRLGSQCEDGSQYPVLINAPTGSVAVTGICSGNGGDWDLLLSPFDNVRSMLNGAGMVGLAIPMASGAFKAVRFSLKGNSEAIRAAEKMVEGRGPRSSTTDSTKRGTVTF